MTATLQWIEIIQLLNDIYRKAVYQLRFINSSSSYSSALLVISKVMFIIMIVIINVIVSSRTWLNKFLFIYLFSSRVLCYGWLVICFDRTNWCSLKQYPEKLSVWHEHVMRQCMWLWCASNHNIKILLVYFASVIHNFRVVFQNCCAIDWGILLFSKFSFLSFLDSLVICNAKHTLCIYAWMFLKPFQSLECIIERTV